VKVVRFFLLLALAGAGLLALPGCGKRPESADSATAQPTPPTQAAPTKAGWLTSYDEGQQEAKANNKLVLLDFTGSDWCGWCIMLDREVFSKPQFKEYASKNLVLVELDFPKMKPLSESIRAQNIKLAQRYQIQAFPTIIVLNGNGQVVGELGYMKGGPDAFIAVLEKMRKG
jgi:protein disulfide-isomerase